MPASGETTKITATTTSRQALLRNTLRQGPPLAFFVKSYSVIAYGKKISSRYPLDKADNRL
jgi:hypothetical protein